jgi:hypothetical protein
MGDYNEQVSWLAGMKPGITFPDLVDPVAFDADNPLTVAGAARALTRVPF